jgi:hypothetical protein
MDYIDDTLGLGIKISQIHAIKYPVSLPVIPAFLSCLLFYLLGKQEIQEKR